MRAVWSQPFTLRSLAWVSAAGVCEAFWFLRSAFQACLGPRWTPDSNKSGRDGAVDVVLPDINRSRRWRLDPDLLGADNLSDLILYLCSPAVPRGSSARLEAEGICLSFLERSLHLFTSKPVPARRTEMGILRLHWLNSTK